MENANANGMPVWPGWETKRLIGRGSYGAVYEIERDTLGEKERAALKLLTIPQSSDEIDNLKAEGCDDQSITNTFKRYLKSIVAEYSMMRRMNGSANVVNCDDVRYIQHDDGYGWDIFIKMELLTPLTKAVGLTESDARVRRIGADLCRALSLCRKHNIIHRDIKPSNIFVSDNGDYKLGDFGVARSLEKNGDATTRVGTYEYMAPEVYNNEPYGASADIYSLGMVLYWLLNEHRTPFLPPPPQVPTSEEKENARRRRFRGEPLPPPAHGSEELKRIVLKACAFKPRDRFLSPEEMENALTAAGEADTERTLQPEKPRFGIIGAERAEEGGACGDGTATVSGPKRAAKPEGGRQYVRGGADAYGGAYRQANGQANGQMNRQANGPVNGGGQYGYRPPERDGGGKKPRVGPILAVVGGVIALALIILLAVKLISSSPATPEPSPTPEPTPTPEPDYLVSYGADFCPVQVPASWLDEIYMEYETDTWYTVRHAATGRWLFSIEFCYMTATDFSESDFVPTLNNNARLGDFYSLLVASGETGYAYGAYPAYEASGTDADSARFNEMLARCPEIVNSARVDDDAVRAMRTLSYDELCRRCRGYRYNIEFCNQNEMLSVPETMYVQGAKRAGIFLCSDRLGRLVVDKSDEYPTVSSECYLRDGLEVTVYAIYNDHALISAPSLDEKTEDARWGWVRLDRLVYVYGS